MRSGGALALFAGASDTNATWYIAASNGAMNWGPGGVSATDVNLYRTAADVLRTDDSFSVGANLLFDNAALASNILFRGTQATSTTLLQSRVTGDSAYRFLIGADGRFNWGPGGATGTDTNLYRSAVNQVGSDHDIVARKTAQQVLLGISGSGYGLVVGSDTPATNLYRSGASQLKTDGSLRVETDFTVIGQFRIQNGYTSRPSIGTYANVGLALYNSGGTLLGYLPIYS